MKNILIDFTYYQWSTAFHGGGEYGNVILNELLKQSDQVNCGIFFYKGKKIDADMLRRCRNAGWNLHAICDRRNLAAIARDYKYTTIYSALPYSGGWSRINFSDSIRFIGTFHGLRRMELADCEGDELDFYRQESETGSSGYIFGTQDQERKNRNRLVYDDAISFFKNGKIIAVSEHTKHSIYYHYPELQNVDIEVLYSPLKLADMAQTDDNQEMLSENQLSPGNFGLVVSAGIWYKNVRRAVLAYDRVFERKYKFIHPDYKVVVLGVKKKADFLNGVANKERFLLMDYVSAGMLEELYRHAQLFVYPSLNEGFGYPPLEAMKYGTLCACSSNTSITEICRDMVLYFNPLLVDEIAIRILESFSENVKAEKEEKMKQMLPVVWNRQKEDLQKLVKIIVGEE